MLFRKTNKTQTIEKIKGTLINAEIAQEFELNNSQKDAADWIKEELKRIIKDYLPKQGLFTLTIATIVKTAIKLEEMIGQDIKSKVGFESFQKIVAEAVKEHVDGYVVAHMNLIRNKKKS